MRWAAYYDYQAIGDTLIVIYNMKAKANKIIKKDDVIALYDHDTLIGLNILHFSDLIKMHTNGRIYILPKPVLNIINDYLANAGFQRLEELATSGFYIAEFIENNTQGAVINVGKENVQLTKTIALENHTLLVVAEKEAILIDSTIASELTKDEYYVLQYHDLGMSQSGYIVLSQNESVGKDYFA